MMVKNRIFSLPFYDICPSFLKRGAVCLFFLFLISGSSFINAQVTVENDEASAVNVTISGGSTIYSVEANFNRSVIENKVIVNGGAAIMHGDVQRLAITSGKDSKERNSSFNSHLKRALKRKEQVKVEKLRKLTEKLKYHSISQCLSGPSSSSHTFLGEKSNISCCTTTFDTLRYSDCQFLVDLNGSSNALHYLYVPCYGRTEQPFDSVGPSSAHSVRPPPLFWQRKRS